MTVTTPLVDTDVVLGPHPRVGSGVLTSAGLLTQMDELMIDEAIVVHASAVRHRPSVGNALIAQETAGKPRLLPAWVVLPDTCGELGSVEEFVRGGRAAGIVAVRAYPAQHRYSLAGPDMMPLLDAIAEARWPLMVDLSETSWPEVSAVASARPGWPVIVSKAGIGELRRAAGVLGRIENVLLATSNLATHSGIEWLAGRFGSERLVFGGGGPVFDPAAAVARLLWSSLSWGDVARVAHGNIRRVINATGAEDR